MACTIRVTLFGVVGVVGVVGGAVKLPELLSLLADGGEEICEGEE